MRNSPIFIKGKIKIVYIATISAIGFAPGISYIQPPLDYPVIVNEFSPCVGDESYKVIIPPITILDATATNVST